MSTLRRYKVARNRTRKFLFRTKIQNKIKNKNDIYEYIKQNDLIFPPSAVYSFADDDESRATLGLDHPLMKSVSLNAHLAASNQLRSDYLIKSCLRSVEERAKDDNATTKVNEELRKLSRSSKIRDSKITMSSNNRTNKLRSIINRSKISTLKLANRNPIKVSKWFEPAAIVGGAGGIDASSPNSPAAPAAPPSSPVSPAALPSSPVSPVLTPVDATTDIVNLKNLLTYDKYLRFCQQSINATNDNWKHIIESCFKFMFCDQVFAISRPHIKLVISGRATTHHIIFKLAYSYHLSHHGNQGITELTRAPSWLISRSGLYDKLPVRIPFVHTSEQLFAHSGHSKLYTTARDITTSDLTRKFKSTSDIDKRHTFYSMLLFIIINMTDAELTTLYRIVIPDSHVDDALIMEQLLRTNSELRREFDNILPHCLFITTYTTKPTSATILNISTSLILLQHRMFVRTINKNSDDDDKNYYFDFKDAYQTMVEHLYYSLGEKVIRHDFSFNIGAPDHMIRHAFQANHDARVHSIGLRENDYCKWTYYKNKDPVRFVPTSDTGANTGRGVIVNSDNVAIFYGLDGRSFVDTQTYSYRNLVGAITAGYVAGTLSSLPKTISINVPLSTVADKSSVFFNEKSRVVDTRDRILGHLSALVYYPNDVVAKVSDNMTATNPYFIYVGPFDTDPCYPRAANPGNPITYSRVHAWMIVKRSIGNPIPDTDNGRLYYELYVVSRGSKTGYDWDAADADIVNGYLNSDRSLNCVYVLKKIINHIDSLLPTRQSRHGVAKMQIYSAGHSLGGYLSLALSHASISRNIVSGISLDNITGNPINNKPLKVVINPYIIPIVFDPFISSEVIINSFSLLPYARIHAVVAPLAGGIITRNRFTDPASELFISNVKTRKTIGIFEIFEYVNVLASPSGQMHRSILTDIRTAHQLEHMNGLSLSYLADHINTDYYLISSTSNGDRQQNMKAAHYEFNLPPDESDIERVVHHNQKLEQAIASIQRPRAPVSLNLLSRVDLLTHFQPPAPAPAPAPHANNLNLFRSAEKFAHLRVASSIMNLHYGQIEFTGRCVRDLRADFGSFMPF